MEVCSSLQGGGLCVTQVRAKILVPNQKIPEFAANSGILGFGTATKRSQAKAMNFAVKIRQPQNSRVRPELWNLPVQLLQLTAGSA